MHIYGSAGTALVFMGAAAFTGLTLGVIASRNRLTRVDATHRGDTTRALMPALMPVLGVLLAAVSVPMGATAAATLGLAGPYTFAVTLALLTYVIQVAPLALTATLTAVATTTAVLAMHARTTRIANPAP